jgi:hypothetical protein
MGVERHLHLGTLEIGFGMTALRFLTAAMRTAAARGSRRLVVSVRFYGMVLGTSRNIIGTPLKSAAW